MVMMGHDEPGVCPACGGAIDDARKEEEAENRLNLACRYCLEDVLAWFEEGGKVHGVGFDEAQIVGVIKGTLAGLYAPESFQSGDVDE